MDTAQNPGSDHKKADPPKSVSAYLDPNYWNQRFSNEEHYEWLKDYSHFRHLIQAQIKPNSSVLELGCGNSQLSEELYKDGITEITCIDLSSVAVEKMKERLLSKGYEGVFPGCLLKFLLLFPSFCVFVLLEFDTRFNNR
ncbi:hypothetical protein V6N12_073057 [Hibiscus sabdariffa]|uniref:Methyltransferase domain-containing protein n=1 Tax=Hibiscus sabdariffa TaxID=183260 RepID=A0ABR1ZNZ8_9ROSI